MSERKVLNKYIPPNFDPKNLSTVKKGPGKHKKVRLMAPFSMQCKTCGEFIYKGKKFNARKESSFGETYLGIQIWRFYITCPVCISEITFKTDPKNTDYTCEHGATRNYEPWRDETAAHNEVKQDRLKIEEDNPMLALENKTLDSKIELDILDALDELRTRNAKLEKVNPEEILDKLIQLADETEPEETVALDKEDEEIARAMFQDIDGHRIKRVVNEDGEETLKKELEKSVKSFNHPNKKRTAADLGIKRKCPNNSANKFVKIEVGKASASASGLSSLASYADSDSE
jgi:RNase P subunit RPR2